MANTTEFRGALCGLAALVCLLAACEGKDVWVGELEEGLYLDECVGEDTVCDPNVDDDTLTLAEPSACEGELGSEMQIDYKVAIADATCPGGEQCSQFPVDMAVAPDRSVWVLGANSAGVSGEGELLWVAHYDDAG